MRTRQNIGIERILHEFGEVWLYGGEIVDKDTAPHPVPERWKTPTSKPSNGWDVIVTCEGGTVRKNSVLFYELQKAIHELAAEKDEKDYGDIVNIAIR